MNKKQIDMIYKGN